MPVKGTGHPVENLVRNTDAKNRGRSPGSRLRSFFLPGRGNIFLCYLMTLSVMLCPIALLFAILFAETQNEEFQAHYHYLRTTIALLVIGLLTGCLLIVLGASLSSLLIFAGLAFAGAALILTVLRCSHGLIRTTRGLPLRNHRTYFI
ncbi:hypothetical protein FIV00_23590 [Labrenzia sp. THAF82]|nr:hypothetical protein FIV00_23590 [Labrenzia sp. THAF82]